MRRPAATINATVVVAVFVFLTVAAMVARPSYAETPYDTTAYAERLLALINNVREQHGRSPLVPTPGTGAIATEWTRRLAAAQELSHNPRLERQLANHGSSDWQWCGENVGVGEWDDPDDLFVAYMRSPEHRANILRASYRFVGIAVVFAGTQAWNTIDFVDTYGAVQPQRVTRQRSSSDRGVTDHVVTQARSTGGSAQAGAIAAIQHPAVTPPAAPPQPVSHAPRRSPSRTVHVEALHLRSVPSTRPVVERDLPAPTRTAPAAAPVVPGPGSRSKPVAVAIAVLAVAAIARRLLVVARPGA